MVLCCFLREIQGLVLGEEAFTLGVHGQRARAVACALVSAPLERAGLCPLPRFDQLCPLCAIFALLPLRRAQMRPAAATCLVLAAALSSVAASGDAVPAAAAAREPKDGAVALRPVAGAPALVHAADQKPLPSCGEWVMF